MARLKTYILAVAAVAMLSACQPRQYALDVAAITATSVQLKAQMSSAKTAALSVSASVSAEEREVIAVVVQRVEDLAAEAEALVHGAGGVAQALISADAIAALYVEIDSAYADARSVIAAHFDELTPDAQRTLRLFDQRAVRLGEAVRRVLATGEGGTDITVLVRDALTVAAGIAKFAVAL